jgi:two-component system nitrogen regulation response regulator GlnG
MPAEFKILIVDDDREKRFLIAVHLQREFQGVRLIECDSGAAAIEKLEHESVDAIVTDNNMSPVNGLELIGWIHQRHPTLPVVMVTGNPEIEAAALESGACAVLPSQKFQEVGAVLKKFLPPG